MRGPKHRSVFHAGWNVEKGFYKTDEWLYPMTKDSGMASINNPAQIRSACCFELSMSPWLLSERGTRRKVGKWVGKERKKHTERRGVDALRGKDAKRDDTWLAKNGGGGGGGKKKKKRKKII
jgi:hypothetical protein